MKKPVKRPEIPPRSSDNDKRRLHPNPDEKVLAVLKGKISYNGIPKHKKDPQSFGLPLYRGKDGDRTLCDEHAGFQPSDMPGIPAMIERGLSAGLIGDGLKQGVPTIIWAISDTGWIFEARISNPATAEYHGYPVRPNEAIAQKVYVRFASWVAKNQDSGSGEALAKCQALYRFQ